MITHDEFNEKVEDFHNKHGDTIERFLDVVPEIDSSYKYFKIGDTHALLMNDLIQNLSEKAVIKVHSFKETQIPLLFIYSDADEMFEPSNVIAEDQVVEKFANEAHLTRMLMVKILSHNHIYEESCIGAYIAMNTFSSKKNKMDQISICFPFELLK